ncbi:hypothetical protein [Streptomyces sp. NPDC046261]|uniref:hypothetical protein n=1 Tax=Streptomyces sp. NPDC046261 TaxID=3157200 RepID=UPI0034083641
MFTLARPVVMGAAAAIGVLGFAVPQAQAADVTVAPGVKVTAKADKNTRAIAAASPAAVAAGTSLCGAGYTLDYAERLPDASRKGTLFTYTKPIPPGGSYNDIPTCAIFDNNTGSAKYMKLKLCSNYTAVPCAVNEGTFSQYAGPVFQKKGGCGLVYAIMKTSKSASSAIIDAKRGATACD